MTRKHYVGLTRMSDRFQYFTSMEEPTFKNAGCRYAAVIGPFKTKRAALWTEKYGHNNPHFQHVQDAERLSREAI